MPRTLTARERREQREQTEEQRVLAWRELCFLNAGAGQREAELLATSLADREQVERALRAGADPRILVRVFL